jgi:hypothetical protein
VLVTALVLVGTLAWRALRRHLSAAADPLVRGQVLFACGALMQMGLHAINDFPMRSQSLACLAVLAFTFLLPVGWPQPPLADDAAQTEDDSAPATAQADPLSA